MPGSGKSTLAAALARFLPHDVSLSMDAELTRLRKRASDETASGKRASDPLLAYRYRGLTRFEWELARNNVLRQLHAGGFALSDARRALSLGLSVLVDETFAWSSRRADFLEAASELGIPAVLLLLATPLETCVERDSKRVLPVGEANILKCASFFEEPDAEYEMFDEIVFLKAEGEGYATASAEEFGESMRTTRRVRPGDGRFASPTERCRDRHPPPACGNGVPQGWGGLDGGVDAGSGGKKRNRSAGKERSGGDEYGKFLSIRLFPFFRD